MILKSIKLEKGKVYVRVDDLSDEEADDLRITIRLIKNITEKKGRAVIAGVVSGLLATISPIIVTAAIKNFDDVNFIAALLGGIGGFCIVYFLTMASVKEANKGDIHELKATARGERCEKFVANCLDESPYLRKEFFRPELVRISIPRN